MSKGFIVSLGLLGILLLALLCTTCGRGEIQDDLLNRTEAALQTAGFGWAAPSLNGRDVTLSGILPSEDLRARALDTASGVHGVRIVKDALQIGSSSAVSGGAEGYSIAALLRDDVVRLTGQVPTEEARGEIVANAEEMAAGREVIDELTVDSAAPPSPWTDFASSAISQMQWFDQGSMKLVGQELTIEGSVAGEESAAQVRQAIEDSRPDGYQLATDLSFPEAVDLSTCQELLTEAMSQSRILFATSSADISSESHGLLDSLSATAQRCPKARIEISGHTDSRGAAEMNRSLSEARAASVRDYLIAKGVSGGRLIARGYGETRPIADNDTPAGLAKNRRIEFKIQ